MNTKVLIISLLGLSLMGAGCTLSANPTKGLTQCGTDKACADVLVATCQPGTFTQEGGVHPETGFDFAILEKKSDTCIMTLHTRVLAPSFNNLEMQCSLPSSIKTSEAANQYIGDVLAGKHPEAGCYGSLIDQVKKPVEIPATSLHNYQRISDLKQLQTGLEMYYSDKNSYPVGKNIVLGSSAASCLNAVGWHAVGCSNPYLANVPADPGTNSYVYNFKDSENYTVTAKLEGAEKVAGLHGTIVVSPSGLKQQ